MDTHNNSKLHKTKTAQQQHKQKQKRTTHKLT